MTAGCSRPAPPGSTGPCLQPPLCTAQARTLSRTTHVGASKTDVPEGAASDPGGLSFRPVRARELAGTRRRYIRHPPPGCPPKSTIRECRHRGTDPGPASNICPPTDFRHKCCVHCRRLGKGRPSSMTLAASGRTGMRRGRPQRHQQTERSSRSGDKMPPGRQSQAQVARVLPTPRKRRT